MTWQYPLENVAQKGTYEIQSLKQKCNNKISSLSEDRDCAVQALARHGIVFISLKSQHTALCPYYNYFSPSHSVLLAIRVKGERSLLKGSFACVRLAYFPLHEARVSWSPRASAAVCTIAILTAQPTEQNTSFSEYYTQYSCVSYSTFLFNDILKHISACHDILDLVS